MASERAHNASTGAIDETVAQEDERTDAQPVPSPRSGSRRLGRRYWWLLAATGTSSLGDGLVQVAFPLLAVTLTDSPLQVAGVAVAARAPWLLVALPAGALADRMDRRRLVATVEVARGIVLLGLGFVIIAGQTTLVLLYVSAFAVGALETVFSAVTRASVPALVDRSEIPRANGYLLAAETTGEQFAGPALGGWLFAWAPAVPFLADALSFAGSAGLLTVALPRMDPPPRPVSTTLMDDVRTGLRWLRAQPWLRILAVIVTVFAFCQSAVLSVLVLYGLDVLGLSESGYGLFLAIGAIGDVLGALLAHRGLEWLGPARAILAASVTAAAGYLILAATSAVPVAVFAYGIEAIAVALGNVATLSLRHHLIPTELFGRVNNAFRMCVYGVIPIGALAGGLATSQFGLRTTFVAAGVVQLSMTALLAPRLVTELARGDTDNP